jgi:hypothetical protein
MCDTHNVATTNGICQGDNDKVYSGMRHYQAPAN